MPVAEAAAGENHWEVRGGVFIGVTKFRPQYQTYCARVESALETGRPAGHSYEPILARLVRVHDLLVKELKAHHSD